MLCDVKMLVVFEDLNGDLIRYSTHGIYEPDQYFRDTWTACERSFTAKDVTFGIRTIIYLSTVPRLLQSEAIQESFRTSREKNDECDERRRFCKERRVLHF